MLGIKEGGGDIAASSWKNFSKEEKQRLDQFSLGATRQRFIVFSRRIVGVSLNILQAVFENLRSDS